MKSWVAAPVSLLLSLLGAPAGATEATVHVEAKGHVRLEQRAAGAPWEKACDAPCDELLDDGAEYRFVDESGPRVPFRFRAPPSGQEGEVVTLRHEPRTATGPVLVVAGGVSSAFGAIGLAFVVLAANQAANRDPSYYREHDPGASGLAVAFAGGASLFVLVLGASMLIGGVVTNANDDGVTQRERPSRRAQRPSLFPLGFTF